MMKRIIFYAAVIALLSGCAPKYGEDFLVEVDSSKVKLENSSTEVILGVLSILGAPVEKEPIRIGASVNIINRWHSDLRVKSLTYELIDEKKVVARGAAKVDPIHGFLVASKTQQALPLALAIDPGSITLNKAVALAQNKSKMVIRGEALIEIWGIERRYPFEKDVTALLQKVSAFKSKKNVNRL